MILHLKNFTAISRNSREIFIMDVSNSINHRRKSLRGIQPNFIPYFLYQSSKFLSDSISLSSSPGDDGSFKWRTFSGEKADTEWRQILLIWPSDEEFRWVQEYNNGSLLTNWKNYWNYVMCMKSINISLKWERWL